MILRVVVSLVEPRQQFGTLVNVTTPARKTAASGGLFSETCR
jgi:hypothetical protein